MVPDDSGSDILMHVFKKGDKTKCPKYRGIDVAAKDLTVFLRRFRSVGTLRRGPTKPGSELGVDA